jgi:hypothetical protein
MEWEPQMKHKKWNERKWLMTQMKRPIKKNKKHWTRELLY